MFLFPDSNGFLSDPQSDTTSAERPPQYNDMNCGCGYRCGWGCEEPVLEEDNDSVSDSDTIAVSQEDSEYEYEFEAEASDLGLEQDGMTLPDNMGEERAGIVLLLNDWSDHPAYTLLHEETDLLSEDLEVHPCMTRSPSITPSSCSSIGTRSPNPGFEVMTAGMPVVQLTRIYYFSEMPLRLSPQHEHCRGDVASHLVIHD